MIFCEKMILTNVIIFLCKFVIDLLKHHFYLCKEAVLLHSNMAVGILSWPVGFWGAVYYPQHRSISTNSKYAFWLHNYDELNNTDWIAMQFLWHQYLGDGDVWSTFKRIQIYLQQWSLLQCSGICWKISSEMMWLIQTISYEKKSSKIVCSHIYKLFISKFREIWQPILVLLILISLTLRCKLFQCLIFTCNLAVWVATWFYINTLNF